jgi:hypothetical protein
MTNNSIIQISIFTELDDKTYLDFLRWLTVNGRNPGGKRDQYMEDVNTFLKTSELFVYLQTSSNFDLITKPHFSVKIFHSRLQDGNPDFVPRRNVHFIENVGRQL